MQTHPAYCSCPEGFEPSRNPRLAFSCVRCGRAEQPRKLLAEHVEEVFELLAETLESAGDKPRDQACPNFDQLRYETLRRVHWGEREFPDAPWRRKYLPREAAEEMFDALAYIAGEIAKQGRDPDLFNVLVHTFRAYESLRQYEARQKGSA